MTHYDNPMGNYIASLPIVTSNKMRMVYENYDSPYEDLLAKCHMSTEECWRSRTLATEVYKAVNGMTPNYIQELFEVKEIPYNLGMSLIFTKSII